MKDLKTASTTAVHHEPVNEPTPGVNEVPDLFPVSGLTSPTQVPPWAQTRPSPPADEVPWQAQLIDATVFSYYLSLSIQFKRASSNVSRKTQVCHIISYDMRYYVTSYHMCCCIISYHWYLFHCFLC